GEARVEFAGNAHTPQHRGGARQMCIDTAYPRALRARNRRIEVNDLRRRMHAGVRAPRSNDAHRASRDCGERVLERVLHAARGRLRLETAETAAVVLESECMSHRARLPKRKKRRGSQAPAAPSSDCESRGGLYAVSFASSDCASDFCCSSP